MFALLITIGTLVVLYFGAMRYAKVLDSKGNKLEANTLFVLAHPDDEYM